MVLRVSAVTAALLSLAVAPGSVAAVGPQPAIASVPAATPEPVVLDRAERAARAAEEWELKGTGAVGEGPERAASLREAGGDVSTYLKSHPNDVRALLLRGRIARAMIVVTPVVVEVEDDGSGRITDGDMAGERDTALSAFAQAIALQPQNADAYYWTARTLNLSSPGAEAVGAETRPDRASALEAARQAAQLAPSNSTYREYLAMVLFGVGQSEEAVEELRKLPFKHPVIQLADDEIAVPAPPNAKADEERAYDMALTLFSGQMDVFKYAGKRPRVFHVALSPSAVEAFYRARWPLIHWVKDGKGGLRSAALLWRQDRLEPTADPAPFLSDFTERVPPSGLLLVVVPEEDAEPSSRLYIVNFRQFDRPE